MKHLTNGSGDALQAPNVIFPQAPPHSIPAPPPPGVQITPGFKSKCSHFFLSFFFFGLCVFVKRLCVSGELCACPCSSWTRMMFSVSSSPSGWKMLVNCASPH